MTGHTRQTRHRRYAVAALAQRRLADFAPPTPRPLLLMALAREVAGLFADHAELSRFALSVRLQPRVSWQASAPSPGGRPRPGTLLVALDPLLTLEAPGCGALAEDEQRSAFAMTHLPRWTLGEGRFEIRRDDALLQQMLALPASDDGAADRLAFVLACHLDAAFARVELLEAAGNLRSQPPAAGPELA